MKKEIIIGIFGIITLLGFIWSYKFLEGSNLFAKDNYFHASYDNVANLDVSSQVEIKGYKVGNITNISLDPTNVDKIQVTFSVKDEISIPKNTIAAIKTGGVMGDKSIELLFTEICNSNCAEDGDELKAGTVGLIQTMLPEKDLDVYINKISDSAKDFMDHMKSDTSSSTIKTSMNNIELTTIRLAVMTEKINRMLDKSTSGLSNTLTSTASITNNLAENNAKISGILSNLEKTLVTINGRLDNTFDKTEGSIVAVKSSMEKLDKSFLELNTMLSSINNGKGSLNKLIHDEKMAKDLVFAIDNLGLLLQDFRLNPKRYVNVSVFGKKQKEYNAPEKDPAFQK